MRRRPPRCHDESANRRMIDHAETTAGGGEDEEENTGRAK
jgi:hypothetical protein